MDQESQKCFGSVVCLTTSRSMSHTRFATLAWGACVRIKTDKSEIMVLSWEELI
jgi:hypothetical protein